MIVSALAAGSAQSADTAAGPRDRNKMQVTKLSDTQILMTRTIAAPRTSVFSALTEVKHLLHWMQSSNMELVECEVEFKVGGQIRFVFQRPNGRKLQVLDRYEVIEPPQKIAFSESYDFSPLRVQVTTELNESQGRTEFKQVLTYATRKERDDDFKGVHDSALDAYERLERYLTSMKKN